MDFSCKPERQASQRRKPSSSTKNWGFRDAIGPRSLSISAAGAWTSNLMILEIFSA